MDSLRDIGTVLYFIMLAAVLLWYIGSIIAAVIRWRKEKPCEFVASICNSLENKSRAWDYSSDEMWLISDVAALEISLQGGNFGRCNTRGVNSGSSNIMTFDGADMRAFKKSLGQWKLNTAIERQHTAETRKRHAVQALAAA